MISDSPSQRRRVHGFVPPLKYNYKIIMTDRTFGSEFNFWRNCINRLPRGPYAYKVSHTPIALSYSRGKTKHPHHPAGKNTEGAAMID